MKSKIILSGLAALALSALSASACPVFVTITCPGADGAPISGVSVCLAGAVDWLGTTPCGVTDDAGTVLFYVPNPGTYTLCVDKSTLPAGAKLSGPACQKVVVPDVAGVNVGIEVSGSFCTPSSGCWMTGGGTIVDGKTLLFSYGGVVYPGCSSKAALGGNWNVIAHQAGLHFQGQTIIVDGCSGDPTGSPKVNVRTIDFHGNGILSGIGGNPDATIAVTFTARATDNHDGGKGADQLYLQVSSGANVLLQIGNSAADPQTVSTGNIQIHTSSCASGKP